MTIREQLAKLNVEDSRLLHYAFDHDIGQYIKLPDGKFVGVNVEHVVHLQPLEVVGKWSYGIDNSVKI